MPVDGGTTFTGTVTPVVPEAGFTWPTSPMMTREVGRSLWIVPVAVAVRSRALTALARVTENATSGASPSLPNSVMLMLCWVTPGANFTTPDLAA